MEEANLKILNYAALALLAVVATPTAALADRINADAPDAATGSFCVPTGIYQIEQNVQVDVAGGVPSLGFPSLHRFGVAKDLELRLESPILAYSQPGGLQRYYADNVIGGPGAFALQIVNFDAFANAMTEKLMMEISAVEPGPTRAAAISVRGQ